MSSVESITEDIGTDSPTQTYSSEFDETHYRSEGPSNVSHNNYVGSQSHRSNTQYSSDFEPTGSPTPRPRYSTQSPSPRPRPRKSINISTTRSYSDDFDTTQKSQEGAGTTNLFEVQTARSIPSIISFEEDTPRYNRNPRRTVRARSLEILTARSAATLGYSDDFESVSKTLPSTRKNGTRYSTDTFTAYTNSFESESSEALSVDSNETPDDDVWTMGSDISDAATVTERSLSESGDSYTYTSQEEDMSYLETPQMKQIADAARRQFILNKLNVLQNSLPTKSVPPTRQVPDKTTATFCRKKIRMLKNKVKGNQEYPIRVNEQYKTPRYHLNATDDRTVESLGISESTFNKLKTENVLKKMEKMATEEIHVPSECPSCIKQLTDVALKDFASRKKTIVQSKEFDAQLALNQYKYGDAVTLAGEGVRELPSYTASKNDIFKKLLQPWSSKVWGSKILKDEEEKEEKERTTVSDSSVYRNELQPSIKPKLTCPHLANFKGNTILKSESSSDFKVRNLYSPIFDDEENTQNINDKVSHSNKDTGVFGILCTKLKEVDLQAQVASPRRVDDSYFPEGGAWDVIKSEIEETPRLNYVPAVGKREKKPLGVDIPTDRKEFWEHYFAPLKAYPGFPKCS